MFIACCDLDEYYVSKTDIMELFDRLDSFLHRKSFHSNTKGQALVEFTLVFLLLLVVAWIPTDFGLAFYTGQLALNASREGARIAAATNPFDATAATNVATETCKRLSRALLQDPGGAGASCSPYSNAKVAVTAPTGATCNQQVTVTVTGNYNYFFLGILKFFGASAPSNFATITRSTQMRWEGQKTCG
jgi:Flp pilus assembly protein TadG